MSESIKAPDQSTVAGRPVVSLSLALNYALGGLNPWGYHAFNLAVLARSGREEDAITQFRAVLKLDPQNLKALHNLAVLLIRRGETDELLALWTEAVRLDPAYLEGRMALAHALSQSGKTNEAIQQFKEMLRQDPQNRIAQAALNQLLGSSSSPPRK